MYTRHRVLRGPRSDTWHNINSSRFEDALGTTFDIYASNRGNALPTRLVRDWRLSKGGPTSEGLTLKTLQ